VSTQPPDSGTETLEPSSPDYKSRGGLRRLLDATVYSLRGLADAWRGEAAFRQELVVGLLLVPVALWLAPTAAEALLLIGAIVLVLVVELLNSAIEAVGDAVTLQSNPMVGRAKDLGSAAVMLSLMLAALIWAAILWPG
jgi:diacylglycerol kinase (ATP)